MSPPSLLPARILGYSLVLGVFLLLSFLAAFFLREAVHTGRTIRVHFPEISTLSEGDAVVENGVAVGRIRRLGLEGGRPVAELQLFHHRFLAADARFVNFSHSLMGARKVWLLPGASPLPLDEGEIQAGFFVPGVPETLHKVHALVERVARLRRETDRLFTEDGFPSESFAIHRRLDEALRTLGALPASLEGAATALQSGTEAFASTGKRARAGLRGAEPGIDSALGDIDALLASVGSVETTLAAALAQAERLAAIAQDTAGKGKLLADRSAYDDLVKSVEALAAITRRLREDGLGDGMKIKPRLRGRETE